MNGPPATATVDLINATFESVGAILTWIDVSRIRRDKIVKGVYWPARAFWSAWGFWNLLYYTTVGHPLSFWAGAVLAVGNTVWVLHALVYARRASRAADWEAKYTHEASRWAGYFGAQKLARRELSASPVPARARRQAIEIKVEPIAPPVGGFIVSVPRGEPFPTVAINGPKCAKHKIPCLRVRTGDGTNTYTLRCPTCIVERGAKGAA